MNDDFLHRLRKAPPPGFLAELKDRLDRQPLVRQPKVTRERPRIGFGRGMIVGFLIAGVSFAVASVSLTGGWPTSAREFWSAPVEYLVQAWERHHDSEQEVERVPVKAQPLGPAWFPTHATAQPASGPYPDTDSAEAIATPVGPSSNTTATSAPAANGGGAQAVAKSSSSYKIGAQRDVYSFLQSTLHNINVVELSGADSFGGLCGTYNARLPLLDYVVAAHRITTDPACKSQHYPRILELKLGYLAVALVRSKLYAPMPLTPRTLFLALARRVPDPADPSRLIDNPYTTWSSISSGSGSALPEDAIQVYGPPQDSPEGRLAVELLLDAGCNTFPSLVTPREQNDPEFESACRELRTDGHYARAPQRTDLVEMLNINPTALGVVSLQWFQAVKNKLNANPVSDISPEYSALSSQSYPLAETLYFYTEGMPVFWMRSLFDNLLTPSFYDITREPAWGFVPLDEPERAINRRDFEAQKFIQF